MPYLQRATNNYFGFVPAYGNQRTNIYQVSSSATTGATAIYPGDVVVYSTLADAGPVVRVATGGTSTDAGVMVGVAASFVGALGGSTGADPRILSTQTVLVYDDPNTVFVGCDTTSGVIGVGPIGKKYALLSTGCVGSTGPGPGNHSVMAISGVSASSGSGRGYRFTVIGIHPVENAYSSISAGTAAAATAVRKWLMLPSQHVQDLETAGVITT